MKNGKQRGYILIVTLLAIAALFFYAITLVRFHFMEKGIAQMGEMTLIAEQAANAGLNDAIYYLKRDPAWSAGFNNAALPHSDAVYFITFNNTQGSPYSTNNSAGTSAVAGYNGRSVPAGAIHIVSVGKSGKATHIKEALVITGKSLFQYVLASNGVIDLKGNITMDSFDSSQGPYGSTRQNSDANILTNQSTSESVKLDGNIQIYGTINSGPGGTENTVIKQNGNPTYMGFYAQPKVQTFSAPAPPSGPNLGNVSASGNITLNPGIYNNLGAASNAVINLKAGTYVFTGEVTIKNASLVVEPNSGPVVIYGLSNLTFDGKSAIQNKTQLAQNLIIYGGQNQSQITLSNLQNAYFALYAPNSDLKIDSGSEIFGSFITSGSKVDTRGDVKIHFDKALKNIGIGGSGSGITVTSRW